jgi:hypothetical protein
MEFPPLLTKIMGGMKLIGHWMFARTDRQMDGETNDENDPYMSLLPFRGETKIY